jgi:hydroxymethylpyrimidine kinase/phosphomethylpyrimidine kinase
MSTNRPTSWDPTRDSRDGRDPRDERDGPELDPQAVPALPRVRTVNAVDLCGLRYLSADLQRLSAVAGGAVVCAPLAAGLARPDDEPAAPFAAAAFEAALHAAAAIDRGPLWVRSGYLVHADAIALLAEYLESTQPAGYLLDPELATRDGRERLSEREHELVRGRLLRHATVVVANAHEASLLTGRGVHSPSEMRDACRALRDRGAACVVVTGAHLDGFARDVFHDGFGFEELGADRVPVEGHVAGAGGVFASAFLAALVEGASPVDAAASAREEVTAALRQRVLWTRSGVYPAGRELPRAVLARGLWMARPVARATRW